MRAKNFLLQLKKLDKLIENKTEERAQWYDMATSTTAASAPETGVRVQSSGNPQRMAAYIEKCIDIEQDIVESIAKAQAERRKIIAVIEQLDATEYDILHKMYVGVFRDGKAHYLDFYEVADIYGKSYSWATTRHGIALKEVQRIIDAQNKL